MTIRSRRFRLAVTAVLSASSLAAAELVVASPANAAPAPSAAPKAVSSDTERPDEWSARSLAALTGRRIEVSGLRTPTSSTFVNPDGTSSLEASTYQRNIADGAGGLRPVDPTLKAKPDGSFAATAHALNPRFASLERSDAIAVATRAGDITFGLSDLVVSKATQAAAAEVMYPQVKNGVDLAYQVLPDAVKETLVLSSAAAGSSFTFDYTAPGMTAAQLADGTITFRDAKGVVAAIPPGAAWDSSAIPSTVPVKLTLTGSGSSVKVQVSVDAAWLNSPLRVFPVRIDPGLTKASNADTAYKSDGFTCTNPTCGIRGGNSQSAGDTYWRSTVHFPYESLFGKHLLSSSIASTVTAGTVNCHSSVWYHVNSEAYSGVGGALTGAVNICSTGTSTGSALTTELQGWATASTSNKRIFFRTAETAGTYTYKEMSATLSVTYNSYPGEPRGRTVKPCFSCSVSPVATASLTPALGAQSSDADGNSLRYQYQVFTGSSPAANATPIVDSGLLSPAQAQATFKSWTVPAGKLANGSTYSYRARAYDGTDYGNWSSVTGGWAVFTVDTTKPLSPTVVSTSFPENVWTDATSGTFTLGNGGSTDVAGYYYHLDGAAQVYQTSTSLSLSGIAKGTHHLYVQSIDGAGNLSPVRDYAFNAGIGAVTSPAQGDRTQKKVKLVAQAKAGFTTARFQYHRATNDPWVDIPLAALTKYSDGSAITSQDIAISGGSTVALNWDLTASPLVGAVDGPVQVKAVFSPGTTNNVTDANDLTLDQTGAGFASDSVGPGMVNLITGDYTLSGSDVSIDAYSNDLTLSRSFSSRAPNATSDGIFGPGWVASVGVADADSDYTKLTVNGSLVSIGTADGTSIGFTRNADNVSYKPEIGLEDLTLTSDNPATTYTLKDLDGNVTVFTQPTGVTGFVPTSISVPGNAQTTSTSWETGANGVIRASRLLAPAPPGVTCNQSVANTGLLAAGCRAIVFNYAPAGTTPPAAGTFGDYPNRISSVTFYGGTNGASPNPTVGPGVQVAAFTYGSDGRLAQSWDPRISPSLKALYTYDTGGRVLELTPPGQTKWSLTYSSTDPGRLTDVRRVDPDPANGTAITTVLYGVPLSGTGAPYDLGSTAIGTWGQTSLPTDATAVIPPLADNHIGTTADLSKAVVHYLDVSGRETYTASPGGRISSTDYDAWGNSIRTLSAANRQRALTSSDPAVTSRLLDDQSVYSADGQLLLETFGPEHDTVVAGTVQRARTHTVNTYDEGAPATGGPYRLLTTSKTGARVAGATTDSEVRTSTTGYDWGLRRPTASTTDPAGLALTSRTAYDSISGKVTSTTLPGSAVTTTAQTTTITYYAAAANSTYPSCGSRPEWAGLVCRTGPSGQPSTGAGRPAIPATYTTYNVWNAPIDVVDKNDSTGTTLRTRHTEYDTAGRPIGSSVTASTSPASVVVPATTMTYDPVNGQLKTSTFTDGAGTHTLTSGYDSLGRRTTYTDADGVTSSVTKFDLRGRIITSDDGKGTQTRGYDPTTGDAISLSDSQAGTWSATYTPAGDLQQVTFPGGLTKDIVTDETGSETDLSYTLPSPCTNDCQRADHADENTFGQQVLHNGVSSQTYTYDAAGRLTGVQDTDGDVCTSRSYFFDPAAANGAGKDGNRTGYASTSAAAGASCPALPTSPATTYAYDAADRATDTGYSYDELGRTINLPGSATLDGVAQAPTFYGNDLAATLGGSSFTLDPTGDRYRAIATSVGTSIRHYAGDGDSPSWSTNPTNSGFQRNVTGLEGDLSALVSNDGTTTTVSIQLTNLHGDVMATTTTAPGIDGYTATIDATEFGAPRTASDIGTKRYGWLGGKTREADNASGIVRMGVRLYNPATGRFLSVDPVPGGNSNAYTYPLDPIQGFDLDGRWGHWKWLHKVAKVAALVSEVSGYVPISICSVCGAISIATGALSAAAYAANNEGREARSQLLSTAAGAAFGGFGKFGRRSFRFAKHSRRLRNGMRRANHYMGKWEGVPDNMYRMSRHLGHTGGWGYISQYGFAGAMSYHDHRHGDI